MTYLADVRALTRKDLLLELRARDTLPAMLLFVVSVFVVFHFSLPAGSSDRAAGGLLWVAIIFTALLGLGRAFVPEREQRVLDALVLAPSDRSAIWVAKSLATGQTRRKRGISYKRQPTLSVCRPRELHACFDGDPDGPAQT